MTRTKKIIILCCVGILLYIAFINLRHYDVTTIIKFYDVISVSQIYQDEMQNIYISEGRKNDLEIWVSKLSCKKGDNMGHLSSDDIIILFDQWGMVFTGQESFLYSLSADKYYIINGDSQALYNEALAIIKP